MCYKRTSLSLLNRRKKKKFCKFYRIGFLMIQRSETNKILLFLQRNLKFTCVKNWLNRLQHPFYAGSHMLTLHHVATELVSKGHEVSVDIDVFVVVVVSLFPCFPRFKQTQIVIIQSQSCLTDSKSRALRYPFTQLKVLLILFVKRPPRTLLAKL